MAGVLPFAHPLIARIVHSRMCPSHLPVAGRVKFAVHAGSYLDVVSQANTTELRVACQHFIFGFHAQSLHLLPLSVDFSRRVTDFRCRSMASPIALALSLHCSPNVSHFSLVTGLDIDSLHPSQRLSSFPSSDMVYWHVVAPKVVMGLRPLHP